MAVVSFSCDEIIFLISLCLSDGKYVKSILRSLLDQDPSMDYELITLSYEDGLLKDGYEGTADAAQDYILMPMFA